MALENSILYFQTVQTQIRELLLEPSDLGLDYLKMWIEFVEFHNNIGNKKWVTVRDKCPQINIQFKWHIPFKKKFKNPKGRTNEKRQTNERTDGRTNGRSDYIMPQILLGGIKIPPIKKLEWSKVQYWSDPIFYLGAKEFSYHQFIEYGGHFRKVTT